MNVFFILYRSSANILLIASEDFSVVRKQIVGPLDVTRGFSSLKRIPGT
jgi:hypothetical protein